MICEEINAVPEKITGALFAMDFDNTISSENIYNLICNIENEQEQWEIARFIPPNGPASQWKKIFEQLINNGHQIAIVSYNAFTNIVRRYLKEIIGLPENILEKFYFSCWFPKRGNGFIGKNQHIAEAVSYFERNGRDRNIILLDDSQRNLDAIESEKVHPTKGKWKIFKYTENSHFFEKLSQFSTELKVKIMQKTGKEKIPLQFKIDAIQNYLVEAESLIFKGVEFSHESFIELMIYLDQHSIRALFFSGCEISSRDIILLAQRLKKNITLQEFSFILSSNHMNIQAANEMADAIRESTSLKKLSFEFNLIGLEYIILSGLYKNISIEYLEIQNLTSQKTELIANILNLNETLITFKVHEIVSTDFSSTEKLAASIRNRKTLTQFICDEDYDEVSEDFCMKIQRACHKDDESEEIEQFSSAEEDFLLPYEEKCKESEKSNNFPRGVEHNLYEAIKRKTFTHQNEIEKFSCLEIEHLQKRQKISGPINYSNSTFIYNFYSFWQNNPPQIQIINRNELIPVTTLTFQ